VEHDLEGTMFYLVVYNSKYNPINIIKSSNLEVIKRHLKDIRFYLIFESSPSFKLPSIKIAEKASKTMHISSKQYLAMLISKYCKKIELETQL
jgi:hypothetical protein